MKPKYFPESNIELEKPKSMTDEECSSLFVRREKGQCISLWKASFWQRIWFLFHGNIWLGVVSGESQPPVWLDCKKSIFPNDESKKYKLSVPSPNRKRRRELQKVANKINGKKH